SGGIHHIAVLVDIELAGAGKEQSSPNPFHLKKAVAIYCHIECVVRGLERSLGEIRLNPGEQDPDPAGGRARASPKTGAYDIGEIRAAGFKPDGAGVRDVVADD